jgi:hypothetical protein
MRRRQWPKEYNSFAHAEWLSSGLKQFRVPT